MAKRRRRRTSIRTAAGTAQQQYLARIRELRDDPTRVLPELVGDEPRPIAKVRSRLQRMKDRKPSWLDKRDKGIVGAVAQALPLADVDRIPRLLDHKVAGKRRFYTVRGHASRPCAIAVQNHDDPRCLAQGYGEMAKQHGLHFFAVPGFWCTGAIPQPPQEWLDAVTKKAEVGLTPQDGGWTCPHDEGKVRLRFYDGPFLAVCGRCDKKAGNLHALVASRYRGPRERQPVGVDILLPDGSAEEPKSRDVASYRARVMPASELIAKVGKNWRDRQREAGGRRYVLGDKEFPDQQRFLAAVGGEPWEQEALAAMTEKGHTSGATTLAGVLESIPEQWPIGLDAILGAGRGHDFLAAHRNEAIRDILRKAHEQAGHRESLADLPPAKPSGPIGAWLDQAVRSHRAEGRRAAVHAAHVGLEQGVPGVHIAAFLDAVGGDIALERRLPAGERQDAKPLTPVIEKLLSASGEAYLEALRSYLLEAGTGETA